MGVRKVMSDDEWRIWSCLASEVVFVCTPRPNATCSLFVGDCIKILDPRKEERLNESLLYVCGTRERKKMTRRACGTCHQVHLEYDGRLIHAPDDERLVTNDSDLINPTQNLYL